MKKVVINDDFGGFSLSPVALEALARRKGHERLYWFEFAGLNGIKPIQQPDYSSWHIAYTMPNPSNDDESFSSRDIKRDDPDLVAVVEELGTERSSDRYAHLRIVEIPDDVEWFIDEYDGREHIAETHRTWY